MIDRYKLRELFQEVFKYSFVGFLYLSFDDVWNLDSSCIVLRDLDNDKHPEEQSPDGLEYVMGIDTLTMIIENAKEQKQGLSDEEVLEAFLFYFDNSAYIKFS